MPASVEVAWKWIDFNPAMTKKSIRQDIIDTGVKEDLLDRGVYVIRLKAPFGISYPNGHSPTLYIGEGDVPTRLYDHREWVKRFQGLGYPFPIQIACAFPRVRKNTKAYKEFEAHLLELFFRRYGTLPLRNSIHETRHFVHSYKKIATHGIIGPGSGSKHKWAIQPLPANSFRTVFERTHED
jgi:hypothetical protein